MKFIFWISVIWVVYVYVGYFLVLALMTGGRGLVASGWLRHSLGHFVLGRFVTRWTSSAKGGPASGGRNDKGKEPSVSLIIAAYNEEATIRRKIEESLNLDYPKDKLEIIVTSDASTDKTDSIVREFADRGVILVRQNERRGKTAVQNLAVAYANGGILVFSDATTIYRKDTIRNLVRNFRDKKVGIVAGEEEFRKDKANNMFKTVSLSWDYEKVLRRLESKFNSLIGVSGCIFAIRKDLYEKLDENLIEDFALPLRVIEKGYKVHLEREAIGYEEAVSRPGDELRRKARIVSGGINAIFYERRLLNPFKFPKISFQLISHKICRWLAPLFFISLFISNAFLLHDGISFKIFFVAQAVCYSLALIGCFMRSSRINMKIVRIPFHFCLVNIAAIIGIFKFLFGEKKVIWEPVR